ncbi:hypothetical protein CF319_g3918 [Tilletia indica]|nr:hypothetical protein CF319_g3918 [Tilletia indica]
MCHVQTDQVAIAHAYEKARQARPRKAAPSQPSTPATSPKSTPAALPAPDKSSPSSSSSPTQLTITAPSNPMLAIGDLSTATATLVITKEGSASITIPVSLRKDA